MNNVDYVVICVNQGVNKCNLHLILEHPDPGLNLPMQVKNPDILNTFVRKDKVYRFMKNVRGSPA